MLDTVLALIGENQPWWFWAAAALVPICVLIFVREFMCWFWKTNKVLRRLEKLEKRINGLELGTANVIPSKKTKQSASTPVKSAPVNSTPLSSEATKQES